MTGTATRTAPRKRSPLKCVGWAAAGGLEAESWSRATTSHATVCGMATQIFISHSTEDAELATDVANLLDHEVSDGLIVCTSASSFAIPNGVEPIRYLRESIEETRLIVFLVTPAFLSSTFCAYEAGAVWALQMPESSPPRLFVLLDERVPYESLPAVLKVQSGHLNRRSDLFHLYDRLNALGLPLRGSVRWNDAVEGFLERHDARRRAANRRPVDVAYVGRPHSCEVFYLFEGNDAWHSWYPDDNGNRDWERWHRFPLPAEATTTSIAAASWGEGHTEVFALGSDGVVRHRWWSDGAWSHWAKMNEGAKLVGRISADSRRSDHVEVCGTRIDGRLIRTSQREDGSWTSWREYAELTGSDQ